MKDDDANAKECLDVVSFNAIAPISRDTKLKGGQWIWIMKPSEVSSNRQAKKASELYS